MFWTLEEVDPVEWRINNLYKCVCQVLITFEEFLKENCVPHYFFGFKKNLMAGDIKMETKHFTKLKAKCQMMRLQIRHLRKNLLEALFQLQLPLNPDECELLDYQ